MKLSEKLDLLDACIDMAACEGAEPLRAVLRTPQAFFAQLAAEAEKPHHGSKELTRALLLRAEEAGLYSPPKEQS